MMGFPGLPVLVIPRISVGQPRSVTEARAVEVWDRIQAALTE